MGFNVFSEIIMSDNHDAVWSDIQFVLFFLERSVHCSSLNSNDYKFAGAIK